MISDASASFLMLPPFVAFEKWSDLNQSRGQKCQRSHLSQVVGIPKTIDNDIPMLDCTFGRSLRSAAERRVVADGRIFFWTSRKQENSRLTRQWWSGRKKIPVKAIGFLTFSHGVPFLFPTSCGTAEFTPRLWHCLYGSRTSHQGDDLKGNIRVALVAFGGRIYFPAIVELYWGPISTELYNSYMYIIIYKYIYIIDIIYIFVFQAYHIYIYNYRIL